MKKLVLCVFSLFLSQLLLAKEGDLQKGSEIAKKSEKANQNFVGEKSDMVMLITNAQGETIKREMTGMTKEMIGEMKKKLLEFQTPRDIKGTKLLTWAHDQEEDDQWLYLPSLKRVKRITSSSKSSSFMGSEFSYEDLGSQSIDKYDYYYIKDDTLDGEAIWVIDRYPKKESAYTKQRLWMSKKHFNALQIHYFNRRDEHFKTAVFTGFKPYQVKGKTIYRAQSVKMENHQTDRSSEFKWNDLKLGVKLSDRKFHKRELKR